MYIVRTVLDIRLVGILALLFAGSIACFTVLNLLRLPPRYVSRRFVDYFCRMGRTYRLKDGISSISKFSQAMLKKR